jgi:hypothetical protein
MILMVFCPKHLVKGEASADPSKPEMLFAGRIGRAIFAARLGLWQKHTAAKTKQQLLLRPDSE